MCDCKETMFFKTNPKTKIADIPFHIDPPPAGHSCEYVRKRNELILPSMAEATRLTRAENPPPQEWEQVWSRHFSKVMDASARTAGLLA